MQLPETIHILDLETTGLFGMNNHEFIVEIGIVSLNTRNGIIKEVYHAYVRPPLSPEDRTWRDAWIFEQGHLSVENVMMGKTPEAVAKEIKPILENTHVTSFNTAFDFDMWLSWSPFSTIKMFRFPCIMKLCQQVMRWKRFPSLVLSVQHFGGVMNGNAHTAVYDAEMAAFVLKQIIKQNKYPIPPDKDHKLTVAPKVTQKVIGGVLQFGKYKGAEVEWVVNNDIRYTEWIILRSRVDPTIKLLFWTHTMSKLFSP